MQYEQLLFYINRYNMPWLFEYITKNMSFTTAYYVYCVVCISSNARFHFCFNAG